MNTLKVLLLSFALLFVVGLVIAQEEVIPIEVTGEEVEEVVEEMVNLDEDIQPEDLEVGEPRLLPDSPFYFLKNWGRAIRCFFAFDPIAKAELRAKFSNEKLMELKKVVVQEKDPEALKKAAENYKEEIEKIKEEADRIKEKARENLEVESFLDKLTRHQILHHKLLQRLETQVPPEAFEKIKECRERHLERFAEVMTKLEDRKEKIREKLEEKLEEIEGSKYKHFKNLEVLKNLEEKVPEEAKEAIQKAQENALKRLQEDLEKMSPEDQERFKEYTEKISGEKERHLEILENLKTEIRAIPETPRILELKEILEEGKIKAIEKIEEKLEKLGCPLWMPPAPGFCKEGRVIIEKDPETGCPLPPRCIIPGEVEIPKPVPPIPPEKPELEKIEIVCISLWDPVCGKDGKTYSNECFAKVAGVEIDYKGVCKEVKPVPEKVIPLEEVIPPPLPLIPE